MVAFLCTFGSTRARNQANALAAGEMKDTVSVGPAAAYVLERYFNKRERAKLFRSWAGSASMWIKVPCISRILDLY
jgi:phospholipid:diacylglycerol acyltransferase